MQVPLLILIWPRMLTAFKVVRQEAAGFLVLFRIHLLNVARLLGLVECAANHTKFMRAHVFFLLGQPHDLFRIILHAAFLAGFECGALHPQVALIALAAHERCAAVAAFDFEASSTGKLRAKTTATAAFLHAFCRMVHAIAKSQLTFRTVERFPEKGVYASDTVKVRRSIVLIPVMDNAHVVFGSLQALVAGCVGTELVEHNDPVLSRI